MTTPNNHSGLSRRDRSRLEDLVGEELVRQDFTSEHFRSMDDSRYLSSRFSEIEDLFIDLMDFAQVPGDLARGYYRQVRSAILTGAEISAGKLRKDGITPEVGHYINVMKYALESYTNTRNSPREFLVQAGHSFDFVTTVVQQSRSREYRFQSMDEAMLTTKVAALHDAAEELMTPGNIFLYGDDARKGDPSQPGLSKEAAVDLVMRMYSERSPVDAQMDLLRRGVVELTKGDDETYPEYYDRVMTLPDEFMFIKVAKMADRLDNMRKIEGLAISGRVFNNIDKGTYLLARSKDLVISELESYTGDRLPPSLLPLVYLHQRLADANIAECGNIEHEIRDRVSQLPNMARKEFYGFLGNYVNDVAKPRIYAETQGNPREFLGSVFGAIGRQLDRYDSQGKLLTAFRREDEQTRMIRLRDALSFPGLRGDLSVVFDGMFDDLAQMLRVEKLLPDLGQDISAWSTDANVYSFIRPQAYAIQLERVCQKLGDVGVENRDYRLDLSQIQRQIQ